MSHSGLALAGALLQGTPLVERLSAIEVEGSERPTLPHGEVLVSMIGLLCLGKSDYADIEAFRHETFFATALGLRRLPSAETLRQRLDQLGSAQLPVLHEESADMIARHAPSLVPCHRQFIPLDVDVSPFGSSGTKKKGVAHKNLRILRENKVAWIVNRNLTRVAEQVARDHPGPRPLPRAPRGQGDLHRRDLSPVRGSAPTGHL